MYPNNILGKICAILEEGGTETETETMVLVPVELCAFLEEGGKRVKLKPKPKPGFWFR